MQLLILLILALAGGSEQSLKEVKPILENIGGREALEVIEKAEEVSAMLSAVKCLTAGGAGGRKGAHDACAVDNTGCFANESSCASSSPLAPVSAIADENIIHRLSCYVALGE